MNAQINFYIIIVMIVITSVISICLITAIICVRRRPKNSSNSRIQSRANAANPNGMLHGYYSPGDYCNGQLLYTGLDGGTLYKHDSNTNSLMNVEVLNGLKYTQYNENPEVLGYLPDDMPYPPTEAVYLPGSSIGNSGDKVQFSPIQTQSHRSYTPNSNQNSNSGIHENDMTMQSRKQMIEPQTMVSFGGGGSGSSGCKSPINNVASVYSTSYMTPNDGHYSNVPHYQNGEGHR